jgi:long-subunit fatty acid transport protein
MKIATRITLCVAGMAVLASSPAFPAGFEKSIMWSGRWAPLGNAAASGATGAEALFFNPAGLAAGKGIEVTGNFSPILSKFSGPIGANASVDSNTGFSPSFGAFASMAPAPRFGFGIGAYASGGTKAVFENVVASPAFANSPATFSSELSVVEFSLGGAYEILDGLRFGAAYRMALVRARLGTATTVGSGASTAFVSLLADNLSDTAWNGFRLGLQYAPAESPWGIGATWRTAVNFSTTGDLSGNVTSAATSGQPVPLTAGGAGVAGVFPQQFDLGGHLTFLPHHRVMAQYTFTEYHKDIALHDNGALTGAATIPFPDLALAWRNMHNLRFGYETTTLEGWAFRAGYVLTSDVTPKSHARPTLASPGFGHTIALGAGTSVLGGALELDGALEYSWAKGTVEATDNPVTGTALGDYSSKAYAAHLGATLRI